MSDTPDSTGQGAPAELTTVTSGGGRRRRALWAALAALAVAGGAVAVVGGDDEASPRLPLTLGDASANGGAAESRSAAPAADMAMVAYVHYSAGDDLPELGGSGVAYRLSGEVDEEAVRDLADALGLSGDPVHEDGYWNLESGDAQLQVYESGGGSWWFNAHTFKDDPGSSTGGGSAGSEGCAAGEACEPSLPATTTTTTRPADLPTREEAQDIALDLLAETGMAVEGAKVTVDGPYEAWYVTVELKVEGLEAAGLSANVSVGSKGEVTSAGGLLATPERLGDYPTIDTREAIDRLNAGTAYGGGGGSAERLAVEEDAAVASEKPETTLATEPAVTDVPAVAPVGSVPPDEPIVCADDAPLAASDTDDAPLAASDTVGGAEPAIAPCGPTEPIEPQEVVLHEADRILVMIGANDDSGDAYLVPGYRMRGSDEWVVDVPAVDDGSLLATDTSVGEG